jgi:hypothetical protein
MGGGKRRVTRVKSEISPALCAVRDDRGVR